VPLGAVAATPLPGRVHTVRHPILSDQAARAFFVGESSQLPRMPSEAAQRAAAGRSLLRQALAGQEPGEDLLEELAGHACALARPNECEVLLARWKLSHPDSPKRIEATEKLRSANYRGVTAKLPSRTVIDELVDLFRGRPLEARTMPGPVRDAVATSNRFAAFFHHAFPFDRAAVKRAWSACASEPRVVQVCLQERRKAERTLGPIHATDAPR
jgi:hypothetical protein